MQEALAERLAEILPQLQPEVSKCTATSQQSMQCVFTLRRRLKRARKGHRWQVVSYCSTHEMALCCVQVAFAYFRSFMDTVRREWFGIDRLRLDKFMMLVRKFVQQTFVHLRRLDW